ncbi:uncharacterized protein DS421_6g188340 [Arachis hypogaea]|nr:uncharacterized protein DS421_6g188340 [Arachis hypogaea]
MAEWSSGSGGYLLQQPHRLPATRGTSGFLGGRSDGGWARFCLFSSTRPSGWPPSTEIER